MTFRTSATLLEWLKEAGAYSYRLEESERPQGLVFIDLLVGKSTMGVRVQRADKQEYRCLTWSEIKRAESNPILRLIDETINATSA